MDRQYQTAELARIIGVHPNTVRFYEDVGLLPPVPRRENGYRVYSQRHLEQLRLIRTALRSEILSDNLRDEAIDILKTAATGEMDRAADATVLYREHIEEELARAREAIALSKTLLAHESAPAAPAVCRGRKEAASLLGITPDVLRDWERNGLLSVPRSGKGHREYGPAELDRLKIIRILRNAHYSQMAILRMLRKAEQGADDLHTAIDTPDEQEDIVSVADRYISSLQLALDDTEAILAQLDCIKKQA